jgi:DNA polymerase-3 subunit delta'
MIELADIPEPDAVEGAPHPRHAARLCGQPEAEAAFLDAVTSGRLHHAWLITGPRGVGKATLAWRLAAFLLARPATGGLFGAPEPSTGLDTDPASPLRHRLAALSEPRLALVRRGWDDDKERLKTEITVDEVRKLRSFFQLSAADGGHRAVIVDPADELNVQAANALLKSLEEPPKATTFFLVCHQPTGLLPTIRSRCRTLRCQPLAPPDMAAALAGAGIDVPEAQAEATATLAAGSAGAAVRLLTLGGLDLYDRLTALIGASPGFDRPAAIKLAEGFGGRQNEPRFDLILSLIDLLLARLARTGTIGALPAASPAEAALLARLAPGPAAGRHWADLQQTLSARARHGKAVNLDPASLILDTLIRIDEAARRASR